MKQIKRISALLLAFLMLLCLCACENGESASSDGASVSEKTLDINAEANAVIEKYSLSGGARFSSKATDATQHLDKDLFFDYYGEADFASVVAYEVYIDQTKPVKPCEFGIFEMKDNAEAKTFKQFLEARINQKIENAKSYPSTDTEPLKTAKFTVSGKYVWYCAVKGGNDDINKTLEGKLS